MLSSAHEVVRSWPSKTRVHHEVRKVMLGYAAMARDAAQTAFGHTPGKAPSKSGAAQVLVQSENQVLDVVVGRRRLNLGPKAGGSSLTRSSAVPGNDQQSWAEHHRAPCSLAKLSRTTNPLSFDSFDTGTISERLSTQLPQSWRIDTPSPSRPSRPGTSLDVTLVPSKLC